MDSVSFYRLLLQNDPNPLIYINAELGPEFANNKAREIFMVGSHDQDSQLISRIRTQWKADKNEMTLSLPTPKGERTFRIQINPILDSHVISGYLLGFSDITDHIKDQQNLLESQRNYGNVFLSSLLRMMVIDPNTYLIKDANKTIQEFYGYTHPQLIGKNLFDLNATKQDSLLPEIQKIKQEKKGRLVTIHRLANGEKMDVEMFIGQLSYMENSDLYVIVNPINSFQTERLACIINSINEPIMIQNANPMSCHENFILVNDKASSLLGFSKKELYSMTPYQLVSTEGEKSRLTDIYRSIIDRKKYLFEINLVDKTQHIINVEFNSCVYEEDGHHYIISVVRDTTTQKKVDEVKDEFVNTITHELRTPIAALKGSLYLLKEKGKENLDDVIEIADRNVERLLGLVNDILDYQKLSMDRLSFHLVQQQINDLVSLIGDEIKIQLDQKGLELSLQLDESIAPIYFDRKRITQVLMNLINNAIKFTSHGRITLRTLQDQDSVIIQVQDTGIGIKKEDIPKLFVPFTQLMDGIDKKGSSGLGLAISKKIINSMGGSIWVESEYQVGTTLSVSIPKKSFFKANPFEQP